MSRFLSAAVDKYRSDTVDYYLRSYFNHHRANALVILRDGVVNPSELRISGMEIRSGGIFLRFGSDEARGGSAAYSRQASGGGASASSGMGSECGSSGRSSRSGSDGGWEWDHAGVQLVGVRARDGSVDSLKREDSLDSLKRDLLVESPCDSLLEVVSADVHVGSDVVE
jgi:hypothetical protein